MLQATTPLWTLSAHSEAVTGISISPHCPGVVSTVSQDKMLKVPSLFILLSPEVENISHRFGTSRGPSLLLLGSETLVLAPFTLLPIVPMCLLSSPLGGIKPATTLRCPKWISTLASVQCSALIMVSSRSWTCATWHLCDRCLENGN